MSEKFHNEGLAHEVEYPALNDYHGHPNYLKVYIALLLLFGISLVASYLDSFMLMVVIVFVVSCLKALLVINYFMHLRWEPVPLQIIIYMALFALTALIIGVYFDVTAVPRDYYTP
ncbi:MAG TPA: hypothetical protein ENK91_08140 [Bacteroidetes bacterium]|nr:hypothetical protein [Bacteroidota bacterium]